MIRVLFGAGSAAAANGITADVDLLLDAGAAGSAGDDFTVHLTLDEGSATIELMPLSVDLALTGIAPLVSTGVSISSPAAAYSIAGLMPVVKSDLAVRVPLGEFAFAVAAPTVATGASVSLASIALGILAAVPEAVGPLSDPDFASVSLLLPLNGANNSTTFTDFSTNALTVSAIGDIKISTAQFKFGGSSALLDGAGDYLSVNNSLLSLAGADFTIETWIRLNSLPGTVWGIFYNGDLASNNNRTQLQVNSSGQVGLFMQAGVGTGVSFTATNALSLNTWHHVACVKTGTDVRIFVDGNIEVAGVYSTTITSSNTFYVGVVRSAGANWSLDGYLDDFRVTKDVARYTSAFTPPVRAHPIS
jgi:hypothetical protein